MSFLKAMFGNYSKRELKRIQPIVDKVLGLEGKYLNMTDEELSSQTIALKERLKMICTHSLTLKVLKKYPIWKLPLKQGVFAFGIKHKLYFLLKLLVGIRR